MANFTLQQKTNFSGFPKAAELIEICGAYTLEASDRAIYNYLLRIAHDSSRLTELNADWEISFAELRRLCSKHESNDRVRDSLRRLRRTEVKITYTSTETNRRRVLETTLLAGTDTDVEDFAGATVKFDIPWKLREILTNSNRWGRIKCEVSYAMTSKYAIALYEMICLRINLQSCVEVMPLHRFRELLCVSPDAYERTVDFAKKVIEPALLEVNGLSDMNVDIALRRKHARAPVRDVAISWSKKSGEEFLQAQLELNRSKVGRMARLRSEKKASVPQLP